MKFPPPRFILPIKPNQYLVQGISHCGAYCVKAILSAYGKDTKGHPKEYHSHWRGRITGETIGKDYWEKIIMSHGLKAQGLNAEHLSPEERILLLKQILSQSHPIMLNIRNGYTADGGYNRLQAEYMGHWITIWGYDDSEKVFYVYDSAVPKNQYDSNLPVGNKKRTYAEILRDWKGASLPKIFPWYRWGSYRFIEVIS